MNALMLKSCNNSSLSHCARMSAAMSFLFMGAVCYYAYCAYYFVFKNRFTGRSLHCAAL